MIEALKQISERFSPPRINLRDGRILDDYGDTRSAELPIAHRYVGDVKANELDKYNDVWPFLNAEDLLFYLYPVLKDFDSNPQCEHIDRYLYSLDSEWSVVEALLGKSDAVVVLETLEYLRKKHGEVANWRSLRSIKLRTAKRVTRGLAGPRRHAQQQRHCQDDVEQAAFHLAEVKSIAEGRTSPAELHPELPPDGLSHAERIAEPRITRRTRIRQDELRLHP